jgi:hypothetical protein
MIRSCLISCSTWKDLSHEKEFHYNDIQNYDPSADKEWYDCILIQERDNQIDKRSKASNGKTRKSIAYPERDIHELYPYVEELPIEEDSTKHK